MKREKERPLKWQFIKANDIIRENSKNKTTFVWEILNENERARVRTKVENGIDVPIISIHLKISSKLLFNVNLNTSISCFKVREGGGLDERMRKR